MALASSTIALIGLGTAAAGTAVSVTQGKKAQAAQRESMQAQEQANAEQRAAQAQSAAQERRAQVREERVKRARILQASENTGVEGSSGEMGAMGGLATNLGTNLGINAGAIARGQRVSALGQQAANANYRASGAMGASQNAGKAANMGFGLFGAAGGFDAFGGGAGTTKQDNSIFGMLGTNRSVAD